MRFYFHEYAENEFDKAVEYYEDCRTGLGIEYALEIKATIERIIQFPKAWTPISKNTRRCLVNRFPFGVIYQEMTNYMHIIAIADLRRKPDYWVDRAK